MTDLLLLLVIGINIFIAVWISKVSEQIVELQANKAELEGLVERLWKIPDVYAAPGKELAHAIRQIIGEYQSREDKE